MQVERCKNCEKIKEINFSYGEYPAEIIKDSDKCKCKKPIKYETKCIFCGKIFLTEKNTANEGICYSCRCA